MADHICKRCEAPFKGPNQRQYCSRACSARISRNKRHGLSGKNRPPEYFSWTEMRHRCSTKTDKQKFAHYGARGITVCERWNSFETFLADMGPRPEGKTLERIDNNGNYEPGNCKWATRLEQNRNKSDRYTEEQDAKIREAIELGYSFRQMAAHVGRSQGSVMTRVYRLGLKSGVERWSGNWSSKKVAA